MIFRASLKWSLEELQFLAFMLQLGYFGTWEQCTTLQTFFMFFTLLKFQLIKLFAPTWLRLVGIV